MLGGRFRLTLHLMWRLCYRWARPLLGLRKEQKLGGKINFFIVSAPYPVSSGGFMLFEEATPQHRQLGGASA